jgi:hypothetical protein
MDWVRILAYITGTVDQELLLCNEYLVAENRILKARLRTPLRLTYAESMTLAEIVYRIGRKALEDVAIAVKPYTLLGWYRRLIARKFDGPKARRYPGRPRIDDEIEQWVVRSAKENTNCDTTMNHVDGSVRCNNHLGGLLKYYHRETA